MQQSQNIMKYNPINNRLFIENRQRLAKSLKPKSAAIIFSNDIVPTNADGTLPFRQNNDLFYLCGADQEETVLIVFPDAQNKAHREILLVKETNDHIAVWEGAKLNKEQATEVSGIETIIWTNQLDTTINSVMIEAENIYLNSNEHLRASKEVETRTDRLNKKLKAQYPLHNYERLAPIMHQLRSVKHSVEIELMQQACNITEKGFRRLLSFVKPGVMEFEIEAELMHEFLRNRSRGFAYEPIIASGASACVLHYNENNRACKDGDVMLLDFGAEYANYASDLSRSIPINGRYNKRQRQVYDAVLRVQKECYKILRPGILLADYHKQVGIIMEKELVDLGLLSMDDIKNQDPAWPAYKKYFMHGTSHYIGLDVHDVGQWHQPISAGSVFTVEPGIYIPEEGLGIRLEDDIIVTNEGHINLMANIPIEAEEIEDLMNA